MKTHDLLDAANLDPAEWVLKAGVYLAPDCGEEKADYLAAAFDDIASESRDPNGAVFMAEHTRRAVRDKLGAWLIDSRFAHKGTCDHCGAWFKFGMVYEHKTGVVTVIGHTCASQYFAVEDKFTLTLNRARKAAATAAENAKNAAAALAQAEAEGITWLYAEKQSGVLGDIASKGRKYGSLSPRQIELVKRIHTGAPSQAAVDAARIREERAAQLARSNYQGEIGKPLTVKVTLIALRTSPGYMPGTQAHWHLLRDENDNVYTHKGSRALGEVPGDLIEATFTVKAHEEYKGTKQTVLQRPRTLTMRRPDTGAKVFER